MPSAATTVADFAVVHPKGPTWPANLLRFHVEFCEPVNVYSARPKLNLVRDDGVDVSGALVDFEEGFWSPDDRWLTVLFHPGRVKSGLRAREELGPALAEGHTFQLTVHLSDREEFLTKVFFAGPAECRPLNPSLWQWGKQTDAAESGLVWTLDRPVDSLSAFAHLRLLNSEGLPLACPRFIDATRIHFPRTAQAAALRIDTRFEDPCGNRIGRAFESMRASDAWSPAALILPVPTFSSNSETITG